MPLHETHALRNAINSPSTSVEDMIGVIKQFNVPIVAGTVKLFLLELNPPVLGWEGWEDSKAVYPAGKFILGSGHGMDAERRCSWRRSGEGHDECGDIGAGPTARRSTIHPRCCCEAFEGVGIFSCQIRMPCLPIRLIDSTKTEESNEVYITKLALSVGRCESNIVPVTFVPTLTLNVRHPASAIRDGNDHTRPHTILVPRRSYQRVPHRVPPVDREEEEGGRPRHADPEAHCASR